MTETDKNDQDSDNLYSEDYIPKEPVEETQSFSGCVLLAVFMTCYIGYEIWFQWDFKDQFYVQIAIAGLVVSFVILVWLLTSISAYIKRKMGSLGSWFAFFAGFLIMLLVSYYWNPSARHERYVLKFEKHVQEYLNLDVVDKEDDPDILIGKAVVIEIKRNNNPPKITSDRLQRLIRADSPEEVTTVILLNWGEKKVPLKDKATVETCEMTAIHKPTNEIIAEKIFQAEWRLINHKTHGKIWSGYLDDTIVYNYIRKLPSRRN